MLIKNILYLSFILLIYIIHEKLQIYDFEEIFALAHTQVIYP